MIRILTAIAVMFVFGSSAHASCLANITTCPSDHSWDGNFGYDDDYHGAGGDPAQCAIRPHEWYNMCGPGTVENNVYSQTYTYTPPAGDTTAPSQVSGLTATPTSQTQINLAWTAATDNTAVTAYKVYRGGTLLATLGNVLTYSNTGLTAHTTYSYQVSALDAAGNEGTKSTAVSATTQGGGTAATMAQTSAWIASHFAALSAINLTGSIFGVSDLAWPGYAHDVNCVGGYYCIRTWSHEAAGDGGTTPTGGKQVGFVNVNVHDQIVDGQFAAGIVTIGGNDWDTELDTYMSNVTITPNLPAWQDYTTTNFDGMTMDGGWEFGHTYASDVTVNNWSDAALDVKPGVLQGVRLHINGSGYNTLKLWWNGPHYIVDSTIVNSRYNAATPSGRDDGGIIWTWFCHQLVVNVYNSTFNGQSTIPDNWISCTDRTGGGPTINYLTVDPRTTGEMNPMFTAP